MSSKRSGAVQFFSQTGSLTGCLKIVDGPTIVELLGTVGGYSHKVPGECSGWSMYGRFSASSQDEAERIITNAALDFLSSAGQPRWDGDRLIDGSAHYPVCVGEVSVFAGTKWSSKLNVFLGLLRYGASWRSRPLADSPEQARLELESDWLAVLEYARGLTR